MADASCLCGGVTWTLEGPFLHMSHCHCSRCRKAHGVAFATYVVGKPDGFALRGGEHVVQFESSPGFFRCFCRRCGSVVPSDPHRGLAVAAAGNFVDDPGIRPQAHIFAASKAPWYEITDALPRFDAYPPGFDSPVVADPPQGAPAGAPGGSCLCGSIAYVVEGKPVRCVSCHCSRCRKVRSAAHASNFFTALDGVRFTRGEELLASYKVPEAQHFTHVFCQRCGSSMPRLDPNRGIAVVPMGSLDDDPGIRPTAHIFVGSKAPWFEITDDLPQYEESTPPA